MLPPALEDYLVKCKNLHLPFESVAPELGKTGWPAEEILKAKQWYTQSPPFPPPIEPAPAIPVSPNIVISQPKIFIAPSQESSAPPKKSPRLGLKLILLVFLLAILIFGGGSAFAYLLATEKIKIANPALVQLASDYTFSFPFIPKTPGFIIGKTLKPKSPVSSFSYEVSISLSSPQFTSLIQTTSLDIVDTGYYNFADKKFPEGTSDLNITKDFQMSSVLKAGKIYLKIQKIPSLLFTAIGLDQAKIEPLYRDWVTFDVSELESEARKNLQAAGSQPTSFDLEMSQKLTHLLQKNILPAALVSQEDVDNIPVYRLHYQPTGDELDKLFIDLTKIFSSEESKAFPSVQNDKPSKYIKDFKVDLYVDRADYRFRKVSLLATLVSEATEGTDWSDAANLPFLTPSEKILVSAVFKMSDFNQVKPVEPPSSFITVDELLKRFQAFSEIAATDESSLGLLGVMNPQKQLAQARNSKRRADINAIESALFMYIADHQAQYPITVSSTEKEIGSSSGQADLCPDLVPEYIACLPSDPDLNQYICKCDTSYRTGYSVKKEADSRITVRALTPELDVEISVTTR